MWQADRAGPSFSLQILWAGKYLDTAQAGSGQPPASASHISIVSGIIIKFQITSYQEVSRGEISGRLMSVQRLEATVYLIKSSDKYLIHDPEISHLQRLHDHHRTRLKVLLRPVLLGKLYKDICPAWISLTDFKGLNNPPWGRSWTKVKL